MAQSQAFELFFFHRWTCSLASTFNLTSSFILPENRLNFRDQSITRLERRRSRMSEVARRVSEVEAARERAAKRARAEEVRRRSGVVLEVEISTFGSAQSVWKCCPNALWDA